MMKSFKYFVLFAALLGFGAAPVMAQGKGSHAREEHPNGPKADRSRGGEASTDRNERSHAKRGEKNDGSSTNSDRSPASNKRRR
jgi:hypothetical protein